MLLYEKKSDQINTIFTESSRHSPLSDHSSLFDSVSGTAINLGRCASGPVPIHGSHQRISSLARDVRDLQPGLIKDSTMMRPAVSSGSDISRPLATEAHPNPSIPELAEENVRGKYIKCPILEPKSKFRHLSVILSVIKISLTFRRGRRETRRSRC